MMIWLRWIELYCHALAEITQGPSDPRPTAGAARGASGAARGASVVVDLSAERAKRRRAAMRAS